MKFLKQLMSGMTGLLLVSCVTINIYFPAAAAEKAADIIIEDVWGEDKKEPANEVPDAEEQSSQSDSKPLALYVLNWLISPAAAVEANLNISSAAINGLQNEMIARHSVLKPYYDNGAIGLTENGLITVRNAKAIALKERNNIKALVVDENQDRNALYSEIARANGHPEWKEDIQSTFARRWVSNASVGWWYQSGGNWKQK